MLSPLSPSRDPRAGRANGSSSSSAARPEVKSPRSAEDSIIQFKNVRIVRHGKIETDDLWVREGKIIDPCKRFWEASKEGSFAADIVIDCHNHIIAPGFIDVQLNGGWGVDFSRTDLDADKIGKVSQNLLSHGVTSYVSTVITSSPDTYRTVIPMLHESQGGAQGANNLGVHLEGPFISILGAHPKQYQRAPEQGMADATAVYGVEDWTPVKIVTLAPEIKGCQDVVKGLSERGVVVSAGHSRASFSEAEESVKNGVTLLTHLFNAMVPFHHRDPGIIGLLGSHQSYRRSLYYSLIVDGIHTHPASVKIAYLAHKDGVVLVTDAMEAMGLPEGSYQLGAMTVEIKDNMAHIAGTDTLAGSVATMDSCVRNFREFSDCSVVEAIKAATENPACCLGLSNRKGTLSFGADADLVLLDDSLNVLATFVNGQLGYLRQAEGGDRGDMTVLEGRERLVGLDQAMQQVTERASQ